MTEHKPHTTSRDPKYIETFHPDAVMALLGAEANHI